MGERNTGIKQADNTIATDSTVTGKGKARALTRSECSAYQMFIFAMTDFEKFSASLVAPPVIQLPFLCSFCPPFPFKTWTLPLWIKKMATLIVMTVV